MFLVGKTLQEKLAEKKKEQQNKQLKNTLHQDSHHSEALKRSLNLPNIPSSLTLSKSAPPITSTAPSTSILPVTRTNIDVPHSLPSLLKNSNAPVKYPLEISTNTKPMTSLQSMTQEATLPSSLMLSKSRVNMPTPKFSADSGISISQVSFSFIKVTILMLIT